LRRLLADDAVRQGAMVFVSQGLVNVLNLAFHVLVSRRLGVTAYGTLNALIAGFTVLTVPSAIATTVVVKYAAEFRALGDLRRLRALTFGIFKVFGYAALGVLALGTLLSPLVAGFFRIDGVAPVVLTVAALALNVLLPVLRGIFQGVEDFRAFAISVLMEAGAKFALAFAFTSWGFGIDGALVAWLLGALASLVWTAAVLVNRYRLETTLPLRFDYERLARTSVAVALMTLCVASLGYSDIVIVKHFFDARTAGLYAAAALAGKILFWLVAFVPTILLPRAIRRAATGTPVFGVLLQAMAVIAAFAGGGLLLFALAAPAVVGALSGAAYLDAAPLLFPYGVAATLLAVLNTVAVYKIGIHRFGFVIPLAAVALIELIALALFHATVYQVIRIVILGAGAAFIVALVTDPEARAPART
jgi:O-antigen/teichoic acid export membrane protein